jgi:ATP-binding cassette subfamily B protein
MFVYLMILDWRLGLSNFISAVIGLVFMSGMMAKSQGSFELTVKKTKKLNDTAVEYINGIEVIKAFGKSKTSYEKFKIAAREGADCFIDWMRRCIWWQAGTMSFLPATFLGVLPIGLLLVSNGSLTPEGFITGIILSAGLITPLVAAFSYTDDILKMKTIFGEVTEILERPDMERPETVTEVPNGSDIVLSDVHFTYKEKEVLHGINMAIRQGEVTAIVGPSGSGKSTVARLIDSLWDPDSGSITYGGVNIKDMPLEYYMGNIAYVAQDNYLFDLSIKENIRLGKAGATDEEVISAAMNSGCHEFILGLENGYDTIVGGAGGHLSGGERQRICIARAMLKDSPVIILDEATAYTDPENEAIVQESVAKLVKGKTLIVIAHRLSTITSSDKIYVINGGNVEAVGTHEELLENSSLYRSMWEAHSMVRDESKEEVAYV